MVDGVEIMDGEVELVDAPHPFVSTGTMERRGRGERSYLIWELLLYWSKNNIRSTSKKKKLLELE